MPDANLARPDLTTFCRLEELGLEVVGQQLQSDRAVLFCRVTGPDRWCRRCGCEVVVRDSVTRALAHEPFGWRPTTLLVTVCRYRCSGCGHVWRQDTSKAAEPRAKLTKGGLRWEMAGIVCQHLTVARVAEGLGVAWNTANHDAVLAEGRRVLIGDPTRLDGVRDIGVDEHVWRHTRKGDKYVTVIIDLTPIRDKTGSARLLDMVEGRSKQAFKTWLAERPQAWRDAVEVVAMDGFTGFKTATTEELPEAVAVMDPFQVVRLAGDAWTSAGGGSNSSFTGTAAAPATRSTMPAARCTPAPGLLTDKQTTRLDALFTTDGHVQVEATWRIYQRMITAYRDTDRAAGQHTMSTLIAALAGTVPSELTELITLGRTLKRRAADVLAYFTRPGTSNGPTEAHKPGSVRGRVRLAGGGATRSTASKPSAWGTPRAALSRFASSQATARQSWRR